MRRLLSSCALAWALIGCNGTVPTPLGTDAAAPRPDASAPRTDAAAIVDATSPVDGGAPVDSGDPVEDSGATSADTGVIIADTGAMADDTGAVVDDGGLIVADTGVVPGDGGPPVPDGAVIATDGGSAPATYVESVLAAPMWVDACAAGAVVMLSDDDDGHGPSTALPFAFSFFGAPRAALWVSTNGYVTFDAEPQDGFEPAIPDTTEGAAVYAYWQDLALLANGAQVCIATVGAAPNRRMVIEWSDLQSLEADDITHLTFEIVLHEGTGLVDLVYNAMTADDPLDAPFVNGTHAGIGLQTAAGAQFVVHTGTVGATTGIRFTP